MLSLKLKCFTIDQDDEDNRVAIYLPGLGQININRTSEGVIIDILNETSPDSIETIGLMDEDFKQ